MKTSLSGLIFDYPSTAKVRFKLSNCFQHDDVPHLYRIKTKRLDFLVPKKMTLRNGQYMFIPKSVYERALEKFYASISPQNLLT